MAEIVVSPTYNSETHESRIQTEKKRKANQKIKHRLQQRSLARARGQTTQGTILGGGVRGRATQSAPDSLMSTPNSMPSLLGDM